MRPVILRLTDNKIYDLSRASDYREVQIVDIMKTMDNRIAVDEDTLKQFIPDEELKRLTKEFQTAFREAGKSEEKRTVDPEFNFYSTNTLL